jgi:small GTP-binding protein
MMTISIVGHLTALFQSILASQIGMEVPHYKVILIGDTTVGKTSIARRQAHSVFDFKMVQTVGVDHLASELRINGQTIKLMLWDTAGQEEFASLVPMYVRGAHVCVIVGSIVDPDSCSHLELWQTRLQQNGENPPVVVAINKSDLLNGAPLTPDDIKTEYGKLFEHIFFVSARTGDSIQELFQQVGILAMKAADQQRNKPPDPEPAGPGDAPCGC